MRIGGRTPTVIAAVFLAGRVISSQAPEPTMLSDADVERALTMGASARKADDLGPCLGDDVAAAVRHTGFVTCIQGPINHIAYLAFDAKREYRTFTVADLKPSDRRVIWAVVARPMKPELVRGDWHITELAKEILFQPHGDKSAPVVRAIDSQLAPVSWSNALGRKIEGRGVTAVFDAAAIPKGPIDLIILTDGKEYRNALSPKDLSRIQ